MSAASMESVQNIRLMTMKDKCKEDSLGNSMWPEQKKRKPGGKEAVLET